MTTEENCEAQKKQRLKKCRWTERRAFGRRKNWRDRKKKKTTGMEKSPNRKL